MPEDCVPVQCSGGEQSLVQVRPMDHSHPTLIAYQQPWLLSFFFFLLAAASAVPTEPITHLALPFLSPASFPLHDSPSVYFFFFF